ncbi:MAG: SBBP repeat-containing protein [Caldisericia bacterium]|nr:SBBP repeat-containing protein [Caldisericia bacterium]
MKKYHKLFSILVSIILLSSLANCSLQKVEQTDSLSGSLDFSTYLGGDGGDSVLSMERDSEGNIYIGGTTSSSNFPMKNAYQDQFHTYGMDAFLAKVTSDGQLLWSTYLGGDNEFNHSPEMNRMYGGDMGELLMEAVNSIQVTNDAIYAGGYTNAESFPEFQYSSPHDYWFLNSFIAEFTLNGEFVRILELPYIEDDGYLVLQNFKWNNDDTIIVGGLQ